MARYRFWFHDRDKDGKPINPDILKAAEEIAPTLARYREEEIDCESTSNDILQAAVEAASNATRKNRIANPAGYITSIYRRFVDKSLDHKKRFIPVGDDFLEDLATSEHGKEGLPWHFGPASDRHKAHQHVRSGARTCWKLLAVL